MLAFGKAQLACRRILAPKSLVVTRPSHWGGDFVSISKRSAEKSARRINKYNKIIKSILSPGSFFTASTAQAHRLPTGERGRSVVLTWVWVETFKADTNGQIIIASLPFAEAPFARIVKANKDSDDIQTVIASRPQPIANDDNWMKTNKVSAWRMNCQSVTCEYTGTTYDCSGRTLAASFQPTIDTKTWLNAQHGINGYARVIDSFPVTQAAIQAQARSYYTGNTVKGTYLVSRHVDSNLPYTYRNQDINKAKAGFWIPDQNVTYTPVTGYLSTDATLGVPIQTADGTQIPLTAPSAMEMGVSYFDGLQAGSTVTAKFVMSVEVMIKPGSTLASQSDQVPARNFAFLQALSRAEAKPNHGDANKNSWGTFFNGLKKAWDFITPISEVAAELLPAQYAAPIKAINSVNARIRNAVAQPRTQPQAQAIQASKAAPPKNKGRLPPAW